MGPAVVDIQSGGYNHSLYHKNQYCTSSYGRTYIDTKFLQIEAFLGLGWIRSETVQY